MTLVSIAAAIFALAVIIFVHELGHFSVAKWCDVEVRCFSLGFGPTIFSRTVGETEYRIAAIPLGGYVSMAGEDGIPEDAPLDPERGFTAKTLLQRTAIISAGPGVNMIFAVVVFACLALFVGLPVPSDLPRIDSLIPGRAAEAAGLRAGESVVAMDGQTMAAWDDIAARMQTADGSPMTLTLADEEGGQREVTLSPMKEKRHDMFGAEIGEVYKLGIGRGVDRKQVGPLESIHVGFSTTWRYTVLVFRTIGGIFQGRVSRHDLGGPIEIAREASRQAQTGITALLAFMALISVNLGVLNILPIPVLDGGHLVLIAAEAIRGRPLSDRVRDGFMQVGVVFIGALMVFVFYNDIARLLSE